MVTLTDSVSKEVTDGTSDLACFSSTVLKVPVSLATPTECSIGGSMGRFTRLNSDGTYGRHRTTEMKQTGTYWNVESP